MTVPAPPNEFSMASSSVRTSWPSSRTKGLRGAPAQARSVPERVRLVQDLWYTLQPTAEDRAPGLDEEFHHTFLGLLSNLSESPEIYPKVRGEIRRVIFPSHTLCSMSRRVRGRRARLPARALRSGSVGGKALRGWVMTSYRNMAGNEFTQPLGDLLRHVVNHATRSPAYRRWP